MNSHRVMSQLGRLMQITALTAAILLLFTTEINAETEQELEPGRRLRIQRAGFRTECVLHRISADSLIVSGQNSSGLRRIAFDQVERVDVRVRRSTGWGAIRGAAIGGSIGGLIGGIYAVATWNDVNVDGGPFAKLFSNTTSTLRLFGAVAVFGIPGMLIGGAVGAILPGERWQRVYLPGRVSIRMDSDRTLFLQYSLSF
ncbi:MAG: hypothetical protein AMJ53_05335 [Gammaproteobacteria bacterium SG8_11]|nr:MAG: hypothetical protein AMJ53_05335 [Gammaproteobacteria bacterium SG8_11]